VNIGLLKSQVVYRSVRFVSYQQERPYPAGFRYAGARQNLQSALNLAVFGCDMYSRQTTAPGRQGGLFGSSSSARRGGKGRQSSACKINAQRVFLFFGMVTLVGLLLSTSVMTSFGGKLPSLRSDSSLDTPATIIRSTISGAQEDVIPSALVDSPTGRALHSDSDSDSETDSELKEATQDEESEQSDVEEEGEDVLKQEFLTKVLEDTQVRNRTRKPSPFPSHH
jgi:hypothetical protein